MKNSKSHYSVIIIGAGPSGIGTAIALSKSGVSSIALIERDDKIGGVPTLYKKKSGGVPTFMRWSRGGIPVYGEQYAKTLSDKLEKTDVEVWLRSQVIKIEANAKKITLVNPNDGQISLTADAIVMASGSREKTIAERGWITGSRPTPVYFTKQLLQMLDDKDQLPMRNPIIIGSDVLAYAASAKLKTAGASNAVIIDKRSSPACPFHERLFFKLWSRPSFHGFNGNAISITGTKSTTGIQADNEHINGDGIIVSGDLIPNSELALIGKLKVNLITRVPDVDNNQQLSEPGWFTAGNMLGGFHSADWCYNNGKRVARSVVNYISKM
ncbi:MAG: FAD-dependent oxidoreductase [Bacteroidota bacterium]